MKSLVKVVFAGALGLACAVPGYAQQDYDTQWRTKPLEKRAYAAKDADATLRNYARCVVNRRFERAHDFVLGRSRERAASVAMGRKLTNADDGCLYGFNSEIRMSFSPEMLSGALGQALTIKYYPDLPAVLAARAVDPVVEGRIVGSLVPAEIFARCVVRRNPTASIALVLSETLSPEESAAVGSLKPDLGPCLLAGSTMTINPLFLRNQIGIAAYRLGVEARPIPARRGA